MAYSFWGGAWILWPPITAAGYVYGALFLGRYLRRSRSLTVADFFGRRFNSRRVQTAAGVTIVIGLGGYLLAVTQGAALLLSELTELTYTQGLWTACISYTLFTLYSGSRGVVLTDTLMFFLFSTVSLLGLFYIVDAKGGWPIALEALITLEEKPDLMSWHGMVGPGRRWETPAELLTWSVIIGVAWSLVVAISPWQSSRYLLAKNEHVVVRSACITAAVVVLIQVALYAAAVTVNLSNLTIDPPDGTMIWAAKNLLPPLLGALLLAGVMAAALSSATTFLSLVGFSVSRDIVPNRKLDDKSMLRFSRVMILVVGAITLLISLNIPRDIWWLTNFVGPVFASSWGPVAFMSVWSSRITANAAFWGIVSGFVGNVVPTFFQEIGWLELPEVLHPIVIGGAVSLVVIVWVSRLGEVTDKERDFRLQLHELPIEEIDDRKTQHTSWIAMSLAVFGVAASTLLLIYYVRHYQLITGVLIEGNEFDWLSGESLSALGWSVVYIFCGLLAYRVIQRSYGAAVTDTPTAKKLGDLQ